jgi:hypothetical protein
VLVIDGAVVRGGVLWVPQVKKKNMLGYARALLVCGMCACVCVCVWLCGLELWREAVAVAVAEVERATVCGVELGMQCDARARRKGPAVL